MTSRGALMFAVFANNERARAAQARLSSETAPIELLATPAEIMHRAQSARSLLGKLGGLLAVSLVVGFVIASLGALLLAALGALPRPVPVALISAGVAIVFAAMLGGLAGGLAFATRSQLQLRRLCSLIEHGHGLLVFPARSELGERLRRSGAVQIGSLS